MDLSILLDKDINDKCTAIHECKSVQRVITALLYYQTLNSTKNENSNAQSIFTQLLLEAYPHYLDDIAHLITKHDSDLEKIHKILTEKAEFVMCKVDACLLSDRHCEISDGKNGNINGNKNDLLSAFHEQTWDNIHFYLVHLFDVGLRQRETHSTDTDELSEEKVGM